MIYLLFIAGLECKFYWRWSLKKCSFLNHIMSNVEHFDYIWWCCLCLDKWCNQFEMNVDLSGFYRKRYASHFPKKHLINYNAEITLDAFNKIMRKLNERIYITLRVPHIFHHSNQDTTMLKLQGNNIEVQVLWNWAVVQAYPMFCIFISLLTYVLINYVAFLIKLFGSENVAKIVQNSNVHILFPLNWFGPIKHTKNNMQ